MKKNKKFYTIIGFVSILILSIVLFVCLKGDKKEEVTAENFKVDQGDGVFYLNGGYMILDTKDKCSYLDGESAYSYDAYTYIYNETTKALYVFVAGDVENVKYGTSEKELLEALEKEYNIKPQKKDAIESKSGTWNYVVMNDYVDFKEDKCDVSAYYQFNENIIYMTIIYSDKESVKETHILDQLKLKDKAIVEFKNESPLKIEEDGTGSYEKEMEKTEYKMYFPEEIAKKSFFHEQEQYVEFETENGTIITCRATKTKEKIQNYYKEEFKVDKEKSIVYKTFNNKKNQLVEYEYCVREMFENTYSYLARVQIHNGDNYLILDINSMHPIENMDEYLQDFALE